MEPTIEPIPTFPDIIVALHLMDTTPPRFHWTLLIQHPDASSGRKYHAIQAAEEPSGWKYDSSEYTLQNSMSVAAAVIVGRLESGSLIEFDTLLRAIPMKIPDVDIQREDKWSCRVWVREALRRLHNAGYIHCPDVDVLEAEMQKYGAAAATTIENETFTKAKLIKAKTSQ